MQDDYPDTIVSWENSINILCSMHVCLHSCASAPRQTLAVGCCTVPPSWAQLSTPVKIAAVLLPLFRHWLSHGMKVACFCVCHFSADVDIETPTDLPWRRSTQLSQWPLGVVCRVHAFNETKLLRAYCQRPAAKGRTRLQFSCKMNGNLSLIKCYKFLMGITTKFS